MPANIKNETIHSFRSKHRDGKLIERGINKNICHNTIRMGYTPVHVELSMSTVDDTENLSVNPVL